jgi:endonuclease/exonuclease/phosphatase family metal-dependent hydrolase
MAKAYGTGPIEGTEHRLRAATLNLWGTHGPWPDRRKAMTAGFDALAPDVVAMQEVIRRDGYDQAADLFPAGYEMAHQQKGLTGDGNGIAIASRWPIAAVHEVDLHLTPRTSDFPCTTLMAEIAAPVGRLLFVNHFPNYQLAYAYEREIQTVAAVRAIEEIVKARPIHVVLAGDLDADPEAASIRFLAGRQSLDGISVCFRDAWESVHPGEPGATYTPWNPLMQSPGWPFRRIDYIFVRCTEASAGPTLRIEACEVIFDEPVDGDWASDHFGVMADLAEWAKGPA